MRRSRRLAACGAATIVLVAAPSRLPPFDGSARAQTATDSQSNSNPVAGHVTEASRRFSVPEAWICAVMGVESAGDTDATSVKGAMGLMQIMPGTYADLSARYGLGPDPYEPRNNIMAGTAYLREMYDRYGAPGFLAAYNAGPGRYEEFLAGRALPLETRAYLARLSPAIERNAAGRLAAAPDPLAWTRATLFAGRWGVSEPAVQPASGASQSVAPTDPVTAPNRESPRPMASLFVPLSGRQP